MISFVSYEVTAYHVSGGPWERNQGGKLLVEPVRDRFQRQDTFSKDETTGVHSENAVHVSRNIEFLKGFYAGFWPVLHILLGFLEFF